MGQQGRERKLTGLNTAGRLQNKGTEQGQRRAGRLRTGPAPRRQEAGGRGKGQTCPVTAPLPSANCKRPPVSNQRLPEILDGRHPPGGSQLNTRRTHRAGTGGNQGWGRGGEKAAARGACAWQAPGCSIWSGPCVECGSSFRVLHKSADSVAPAFCAFPALSGSGSQRPGRPLPGCGAPFPSVASGPGSQRLGRPLPRCSAPFPSAARGLGALSPGVVRLFPLRPQRVPPSGVSGSL